MEGWDGSAGKNRKGQGAMSGRIWVMGAGLAVLVLAGCGGSSSTGGTGSGTEATTVTFKFTGATPTAVATKIGSGVYAAVTPASTVTFEVPSGTTDFSVAYVCPAVVSALGSTPLSVREEKVVDASTADGTSYSESCPTDTSNTTEETLTASVDASALAGTAAVELDASSGSLSRYATGTGATTTLSLSAPRGSYHMGVLAYGSQDLSSTGAGVPLLGAKFFQNQAVPGALNGGKPVVLTAADATTLEPLSFSNVPEGFGTPYAQVTFMPAGQKTSVVMTSGATGAYPVMPSAVTQNGGTYQINAGAYEGILSGSESIVTVQRVLSTAGPVSVSFPAAWSYAGPVAAALPTFSYSYTGFSDSTKAERTGQMNWLTSDGSGIIGSMVIELTATAGYQGGASTLSVPDLTGMMGFIASPATGTRVTWIAALASGSSSSASGSPGTSSQTVERMGTFLVP